MSDSHIQYEGWEEDYRNLLIYLSEKLPKNLKYPITFEVISHRYTTRAKNIINEVFPDNTLPMTDEDRTYKYGQFGYGKYVYPKESLAHMKEFFKNNPRKIFCNEYIDDNNFGGIDYVLEKLRKRKEE